MILSQLVQFLRLTTASSSSEAHPLTSVLFRHPLGLVPLTPGSPIKTLWPLHLSQKRGHSGPDVTHLGVWYVASSLYFATFKSRSFLLPSNNLAFILHYKIVLPVIPCRRHPPNPWTLCFLCSDTILLNVQSFQRLTVNTLIRSLRWSMCLQLDCTATATAHPRPRSFLKAAFPPQSQFYVSHHFASLVTVSYLYFGAYASCRGNFRPLEECKALNKHLTDKYFVSGLPWHNPNSVSHFDLILFF